MSGRGLKGTNSRCLCSASGESSAGLEHPRGVCLESEGTHSWKLKLALGELAHRVGTEHGGQHWSLGR